MAMLPRRKIIKTGIDGDLPPAEQGIAASNCPASGALSGRVPVVARA
jgi:hypothetical protein